MQVTQQFLKAKKQTGLKAVLVMDLPDNNEGQFIRLCFEVKNKITGNKDMIFVETPTEIKYDFFGPKQPVKRLAFHESVYSGYNNYINSFLSLIKAGSDVKFLVQINNLTDNLRAVNFTRHELIGIIDGKSFLLSFYVGPQNLGSPVQL